MIALWGEHQVADIDATDTLAATLSAFFAIEALFGRPRFRWWWIIAAGLAVGATMMTKLHAGLPIVAGVVLYPAICSLRRFRSSNAKKRRNIWGRFGGQLAQPAAWVPLLVGTIIFAVYFELAWHRSKQLGFGLDLSGLHEGVRNLHPGTLRQFLLASALPPTVFFYSLPASLALPLSFWSTIRRAMGDGRQRRIAGALAGAVIISWVICLLSGMVNPRYAYPTIATLCPLAGIVAVAGVRAGGSAADWIRGTALVSAIALGGAGVGLAYGAWKISHHTMPHATFPLAMCALMSLATAAWVLWRMARSWRAAWEMVALVIIVSVPFAFERSFARTASSGKQEAEEVQRMVGDNMTIAQGQSLTFKPEIFFYAHTPTVAYLPGSFKPENVPPGTWVFLDTDEFARWQQRLGPRLQHAKMIAKGGGRPYYLAWYAPAPNPEIRNPNTRIKPE
jgi:hypothetical protein